jgi:hypothetical protein
VVESGRRHGTASIKSHHNVGGCRRTSVSSWWSRCAACSRTRYARIGQELGLPPEIVWRQPFPGPGLGIRIIGEVTQERLQILREADAIVREELSRAGLDRTSGSARWCCWPTIRSVGVQGDVRTYGHPVVLRPVTSEDAMTPTGRGCRTRAGRHLHPDHQRGAPRSTGWSRHTEQAARHHRMGVAGPPLPRDARAKAGPVGVSSVPPRRPPGTVRGINADPRVAGGREPGNLVERLAAEAAPLPTAWESSLTMGRSPWVVAVVAWPAVVSSDAASTAHASQMWASRPARIFWCGPGTWPQNEHAGTCSDLVPPAPSSSPSRPPGVARHAGWGARYAALAGRDGRPSGRAAWPGDLLAAAIRRMVSAASQTSVKRLVIGAGPSRSRSGVR